MTDIDAYIQPAAATTWLAAHVVFATSWTLATADQKNAALVEASDIIDSLPLKGSKYQDDTAQPRSFPRVPDRAAQVAPYDSEADFQSDVDYSVVPQEILDACCLEALEILKQGVSGRRALQSQGVKSYTIGGKLQETFEDAAIPRVLSQKARAKLRYWMAGIVEGV